MKKATVNQIRAQQWSNNSTGPLGLRVLITEASKILGVSRRTIWNWECRGLMPPSMKRGVRMSYSRDDLRKLTSIIRAIGGYEDV